MDESRQNAYLYLIQELLRCPCSREQALLNDNRDLLSILDSRAQSRRTRSA